MADDDRKLSITYSSGLIPPPEHMSTLAVFYDEIWLPHPYYLDLESCQKCGELYSFLSKCLSGIEQREALNLIQQQFHFLKTKWVLLFEKKLLQTLRPSSIAQIKNTKIPSQFIFPDCSYEYIYNYYLNTIIYALRRYVHEDNFDAAMAEMCINFASPFIVGMHRVRNDKPSPELFISNPSDTSTFRLAGFLVDAIFQMRIPQLRVLNSEQILEVRYKLRNFKEGFTDYVIRLTNDVESLLRSGETSELVAARKVAERHFETEYNQVRRQIEPIKIMSMGSILAASGAFFLTGAVQTTPALLAALAVLYGTVLKDFWQKEVAESANDKQAFKYIAKLGSEVSRRSP